ncbi:MAG: GIY-YIG nuclease family protein [Planctomycetes bacterium]|nr:GIY-YIG nuclease family protein [Planctomycetota bacterium]
MSKFSKELEEILKTDPLGLLDVKPKASSIMSADQRLIASFQDINDFVREHGGEPTQSRDIKERKLFSRLKSLRESPEKAAALAEYDTFELLVDVKFPEPIEINSIDDILGDDALGLLGDDETDPNDIFRLTNVPKSIDMPDSIARRKPCKDFDLFENLFKLCHAGLASGKKKLRKFMGEQQIAVSNFFVLHGVLVYVAAMGEKEQKKGKLNARLRCIFENGTESNMLMRSLAAELYKGGSGRRVVNHIDGLFDGPKQVTEGDEATGYIYVLRSLSEDPQIKEIKDLHKIGFSSQPVQQRIQNAAQEPTYLMAGVKLITEFETYNFNPQKLENLLHTFFAESCLNLSVTDSKGNQHAPREWFIVPLDVIETAVQLLISGEIVNYRYDSQQQAIAAK